MNTQSNAMSESALHSPGVAQTISAPPRPFYWSLRREFWENRFLYIAPLAVAALFLLGFLIGMIHLPGKMRAALALNPMQQYKLIEEPYDFAALLLMGTTVIVAVFYCLDALYGERRDRSILFWMSLPVSDVTTVLAKATIPLFILPLLTFVITLATHWIMLLLSGAVLLGSGVSLGTLWSHLPLSRMWLMLLYHLVAIHGIWYAPFFGWLLLVSAWARRAPFLWAVLPPFAIGIAEKVAFNTSHFATLLLHRFVSGPNRGAPGVDSMSMDTLTPFTLGQFLSSPGLWIGLAITAVFLAAAVRLRRHRGPI